MTETIVFSRQEVERLFIETRDWSPAAMRETLQRLHDTALNLYAQIDHLRHLRAENTELLSRLCCKQGWPCPHDEDHPGGVRVMRFPGQCRECPHHLDSHDWTGCTECDACPIVLMDEIQTVLTPHAEEAGRD